MKLIFYFLFLFFSALILASLEVQIEGKYGWAAKLPTFHLKKKIGVKPITGYHIFFLTFTFLILHFPVFFLKTWNWQREFLTFGSWIFIWSLEDFLWFIINPHYGLNKFNKNNKNIWWHKSWFLGLPSFYWFTFPLSTILIALGWQ